MICIFIFFIFSSIFLNANELKNTDLISIKNIEEIEKIMEENTNKNSDFIFNFFLESKILLQNSKPVTIQRSMSLSSNYSEIHFTNFNGSSIFVVSKPLSFFSLKNFLFVFDIKEERLSFVLFAKNVAQIQIESLQIINFCSSFSIFTLEDHSLDFFYFNALIHFKIRNLTMKKSKMLSLVSDSKFFHVLSKNDRTKYFKNIIQSSIIIENMLVIDCYILKEFISSPKFLNYYLFNVVFMDCLFNGSMIQNKISHSTLSIKISIFLIENCKFLGQSIFNIKAADKQVYFLLVMLNITNTKIEKDVIYASMLKIVEQPIIIFIIQSNFINLNLKTNCFRLLKAKVVLYQTIFQLIKNLSIRKQKFIILKECSEFEGYLNTFNSISNFQNMLYANSKLTSLKLLLISSQFVNIPSFGSIFLLLNQNKLNISLMNNSISKILILKSTPIYTTSFNVSNAIINLKGRYANIIFKENTILNVNECKYMFYFNSLQSDLLFQKNSYQEIFFNQNDFLAQNFFMISFCSIYVGNIVVFHEVFLNITFRFSLYYLNSFTGTISDISFVNLGMRIDTFLISRTLIKSVDSSLSISNIYDKHLYLNFLININSFTNISNINLESYNDYRKGFSLFFGFECLFKINNLYYQNGYVEYLRCFFILILNSKKNKISEINNLSISNMLMKFSIITSYLSNIEISNIFILEFKYPAKSYSNYFSISDMIQKNILFSDFQYYKKMDDIFNYLILFYFFSSNIKIDSSDFRDINIYENPLIKTEYSSISLENSKFKSVFCFFESILCFINNFYILLKNNEFENNFDHMGAIRIINEMSFNNSYKFQFESQKFYINESLLMIYIVKADFIIEYLRKYSNFFFLYWMFESWINIVSSNNIFNFMGSGIYHINKCIFSIIPKTSTLILNDVDQILIIECSFITKKVLYDKPQINSYENSFFNKSLIQVNNQMKYLRILESFFESTFSEKGSVLYISLPEINSFQTRVEIFNCTFTNNSALQEGGVFYFISKDLFFLIKNNFFYNNSAGSHGGVLYSESQGKISGNTFFYNKAEISGGVVRWNKIEPIFECDDIALGNAAGYGEFIASEARHVILLNVSDSIVENKYFYDVYMENRRNMDFKAVLEKDCDKFSKNVAMEYFELNINNKSNLLLKDDIKIVFGLYDLYYQLAAINNFFIFQIINFSPDHGIIKEKDFIKYDSYGFIILEDLEFIFTKPDGAIKFFIEKVPFFDDFEAQIDSLSQKMEVMMNNCFPEIKKNHRTDYLIVESNLICLLGEYFQNSKCIKCPDDYYTLTEFNKMIESNLTSNNLNCNKKPNFAKYAFGSVIIPFDGYWIEKGKDIIYECIYRDACIYPTLEENFKENTSFYSTPFGTVCLLGFDGNFCGECSNNTDLYNDRKCVDCKELNESILFNSFNLLFLLFFYEIAILSAGTITFKSENKIETPLFKISMNLILTIEIIRKKIIKMEMINNVISNGDSFFQFYYEIIQYFGSLANPSKIVTFRCLTTYFFSPNYYPYFKLIFILILPFFFLILSLLLFCFILEKKKKLSLKYFLIKSMSLISMIQFIFIYELIKVLFSFLNCIPFYDDKVLKTFPDLSCSNKNYLLIRNYLVLPSLIFFVLIIPLVSYIAIFRNKHTIKTDNMIKKFGFIYLGYKPKYFFWEYVIYFKKLSLIIFDVLSESDTFSINYFLGLSIIYLFYHYQLLLHPPFKSRILFEIEVLASYLSLIILGFCVAFASSQRKKINLGMQIGNYFFDDTSSFFDQVHLTIVIIFSGVFLIIFLKVLSSRYLSYIKILILNFSKNNKKMNDSSLKSVIFNEHKLYFLKYLDLFQEKNKNNLFLANLFFQEQIKILIVKKIVVFNQCKINSAIEKILNQKLRMKNSKIMKNDEKLLLNRILNQNSFFILDMMRNMNFAQFNETLGLHNFNASKQRKIFFEFFYESLRIRNIFKKNK